MSVRPRLIYLRSPEEIPEFHNLEEAKAIRGCDTNGFFRSRRSLKLLDPMEAPVTQEPRRLIERAQGGDQQLIELPKGTLPT